MHTHDPNEEQADQRMPCVEEQELLPVPVELTTRAIEFLRDGRSRFRGLKCFGFVPSNYEQAWAVLNGLPRGSFCEWGSGFGIVVGLAEMLGFQASGIELEEELVDKSLALLRDHGLQASITAGSYLDSREVHDYYYVYSWPGQIPATEAHFADIASERSKLLICYGQDILNCRIPIKSKKYS
jgi:hypothetical protein